MRKGVEGRDLRSGGERLKGGTPGEGVVGEGQISSLKS